MLTVVAFFFVSKASEEAKGDIGALNAFQGGEGSTGSWMKSAEPEWLQDIWQHSVLPLDSTI